MPLRLAIVCTHSIQYYAPVFRQLGQQAGLKIHVFYGWRGASESAFDPGFGRIIRWDIPLLEGYPFSFLGNRARDPGPHHFAGIDCPDANERISAWRPDALLVFGWAYRTHLRALRHFHGLIPVLFRGDSTLLDERPGLRRHLRRAWLTWVYSHVDLALYVGSHNRAYFEAHGLEPHQLVHMPHAIDNARFQSGAEALEREAEAWRQEMCIGTEDVVFLFAGKLEPKKAPQVLLEAFRRLDGMRAHLVFAGSGVMEESLRGARVPRTHFLGFQNQSRMPVVYRLGEAVVLPSMGPEETWGLALNEAMACGRAVIASDKVGGAVDLISPGKNGEIVSAGDVGALAVAMREMCRDRARLHRMGERSRELIADWSIERQIEGIVHGCQLAVSAHRYFDRQMAVS